MTYRRFQYGRFQRSRDGERMSVANIGFVNRNIMTMSFTKMKGNLSAIIPFASGRASFILHPSSFILQPSAICFLPAAY
jgi:hypothetical protein